MNLERYIDPLFSAAHDDEFDIIHLPGIRTTELPNGTAVTLISGETLQQSATALFLRLSFTFTKEHLESIIRISNDSEASDNDRLIASYMLKNAATSAMGILPLCQDTGIANVFGWQGSHVLFDGDTTERNAANWIESGIADVYRNHNLRFSTNCPETFFTEKDPHNNLPAQIILYCSGGETKRALNSFRFLCTAKGGGSSNKTTFIQGTKALLNTKDFEELLIKQISALGTAACPPYLLAVVVGGLSPEQNLLTLKLATAGAFAGLKPVAADTVQTEDLFRDAYWERKVIEIAVATGFGAQFGGKYLATQAVVIRLPRHGASCPVSIGVSCSAHRNLLGYIDKDGLHLQKTVSDPQSLPGFFAAAAFIPQEKPVKINLSAGIDEICRTLDTCKTGTPLLLNGQMLVARDKAHARWKEILTASGKLPAYVAQYAICYAGPAQTPTNEVIGSFGPTTAGRMDSYIDLFMQNGASRITIAKGNRSQAVADACKKYNGFYLGTPGGVAAIIANEHIATVQTIDYQEFGMEAVLLVTVKNLPAFVLVDNKGNDFYRQIQVTQ